MSQRREFYTILIGTYLMVTVYAVLHDQYLVRIAPEHFTIYHEPLWGIKNAKLLAAAYAFCSAPFPALALGCVGAFFALALPERWEPARHRRFFKGVACVIIAAEIFSASTGLYAYLSHEMLYPEKWYPDKTLPLIVTQTIQLSCYFSSAAFSCVFFVVMIRNRMRQPLLA